MVWKYSGWPNCPPHSGHLTFFSFNNAPNCSRLSPSVSIPAASFTIWSARNLRLQLLHSVMGSLKLATWPEASKTFEAVMIGVDISKNPWGLRKMFLHSSSRRLLSVTPYGPFFFQAEDGIRDADVTGVQTCALPI